MKHNFRFFAKQSTSLCSTLILIFTISTVFVSQTAAETININLNDYITKGGTISVDGGGIGSTRNGAYVIYKVTVSETGIYDAFALFGSKYDGSSLSVDMDVDADVLASRLTEPPLTKDVVNTGSWTPSRRYTFGPFRLQAGHEYYLRLTFLQNHSPRAEARL